MKSPRMRNSALGLLLAVACLAGCASTRHADTRHAVARSGNPTCFRLSDFNGSWTVLGGRELIVYAPRYADAYLIELFDTTIPDLRSYQHLSFLAGNHTNRICSASTDYLLVPRWGAIPILTVRELSAQEQHQLLQSRHIALAAGTTPTKGNQELASVRRADGVEPQ